MASPNGVSFPMGGWITIVFTAKLLVLRTGSQLLDDLSVVRPSSDSSFVQCRLPDGPDHSIAGSSGCCTPDSTSGFPTFWGQVPRPDGGCERTRGVKGGKLWRELKGNKNGDSK